MHDVPSRSSAAGAIPATLGAVLLLGLACGSGMAVAQDALPRPLCGGMAPFPDYPAAAAPGAAPAAIQAWQAGV